MAAGTTARRRVAGLGRRPGVSGLRERRHHVEHGVMCVRRSLLSIALEIGGGARTTALARLPRTTAIAFASRPSRVRRVAFIMSIFGSAFMGVDPVVGIPAKRERCPSCAEGIRSVSCVCGRTENGTVSGCGRSAPPSPRDWLARRRARGWRQWSRAPVRETSAAMTASPRTWM